MTAVSYDSKLFGLPKTNFKKNYRSLILSGLTSEKQRDNVENNVMKMNEHMTPPVSVRLYDHHIY